MKGWPLAPEPRGVERQTPYPKEDNEEVQRTISNLHSVEKNERLTVKMCVCIRLSGQVHLTLCRQIVLALTRVYLDVGIGVGKGGLLKKQSCLYLGL